MKRRLRDLRDSPFSQDRLIIWAVGIVLVLSVLAMAYLSAMRIEIPRPIQNVASVSLGGFLALLNANFRRDE